MPSRQKTTHIVVHCSATKPTLDIGRQQIREWHLAKGWADIGYSLVVRRNGLLEMGRHPDDIGAHVAGHNSTSVGICLVGGLYVDGKEAEDDFDGLFTKEQASALKNVLLFYKALYPSAEILGHRDLSPDKDNDGKVERHEWLKTCPGFDVRAWCQRNGI
jgi:hypothetical protein